MGNMSMYTRFVEPGRLAHITYGPCSGKMCTIIDIVDQKKVVVDGPKSITDLKTKIPRGAREKTLKLALDRDEIMKKWSETNWAKKLKAKEVRANMNDFDRFKLMVAKKNRSKIVRKTLFKKE